MCRSGRASFYAGTKSLFIFKKGFSQLTYKDFRVRSAHLSPGLPTGLTRVNPGWVLSLILKKVGNTGSSNILNVQMFRIVQIGGY